MSFAFIPVGYLSEVFMNAEILKKIYKKKLVKVCGQGVACFNFRLSEVR